MIFNSLSFLIFFVIVFFLYYFLFKENTKYQNWILLLSSYFFYGYVNWKIIPILLIATVIIFTLGIAIHSTEENEKKSSWLATLGILLGIGLLVYFKYFNFFIDSFSSVLNTLGLKSNIGTFNIIMPIGISFFTFKLISYIIEVHSGQIEPSKDFGVFATYVAFFPTIMSGPIDRPNNFIPQLLSKRSFKYDLTVNGCRQILWGLFQKAVIADNLATIINGVWDDIPNQSASKLLLIAILYSFQLYTDFSGYSHMAIGVGKILGFHITKNFNYPYFSRNIAEFWRNWHISLTSWLTDYIFMPLSFKFRSFGNWGLILAIIINFILVGLWHGANWTFVIYGLFHGLLFIPLILTETIFKKNKLNVNKYGLPSINDFFKIIGTFSIWTLSLIIFRADNILQAWNYFLDIFSPSLLNAPKFTSHDLALIFIIIIFIFIFMLIEWYGKETECPLFQLDKMKNKYSRWVIYFIILLSTIIFTGGKQVFIYVQF
ncbi:MBOAT family O-acyltransferase [Lutibacter citreus]|uniref:MBOAT family O-acyltransferase n=1 Tax=Lutibacter citreus TaxID=2138210 RepID=UPI000DBE7B36|nr:MBOAT family O-acyltransferase [Lutibacter citreus]